MQDFETEEQQIEALKKWLRENGLSLVLGLTVGVGGLLGWRYYEDMKTGHAEQASDMYQAVIAQVSAENPTNEAALMADTLRGSYADTPYAALATLAQARQSYEQGNIDETLTHLYWVAGNATETDIRHIANLRIARILLSQQKYDEAEQILNAEHPAGFEAGYAELMGDLYRARGERAQAREAYDRAIDADEGGAGKWLQLKRQDLGDS